MSVKTIRARYKHPNISSEDWMASDPVLLSGEVGYESDTGKSKVGDGTKTWNELEYTGKDKVDKVTGKGLSTNDYTTAEKTKLAGIAEGANNYTHPATHPASMITGLGTAAVKDTGTSEGNVPVIESSGKIDEAVIPDNYLTDTDYATFERAGVVKSSNKVNEVTVKADGTMTLRGLQTSFNVTGDVSDTECSIIVGPDIIGNDVVLTLKDIVTAGTGTKVTIDAKGRVTVLGNLTASDVPNLTLSKISDAGTAASKNIGTAEGDVPVLGTGGKLASEVLPEIPSPVTVYNGLDSNSATDALSAAQGKILADQIGDIGTILDSINGEVV